MNKNWDFNCSPWEQRGCPGRTMPSRYEVIEKTRNQKGRWLLGGCSNEREVTSAHNTSWKLWARSGGKHAFIKFTPTCKDYLRTPQQLLSYYLIWTIHYKWSYLHICMDAFPFSFFIHALTLKGLKSIQNLFGDIQVPSTWTPITRTRTSRAGARS